MAFSDQQDLGPQLHLSKYTVQMDSTSSVTEPLHPGRSKEIKGIERPSSLSQLCTFHRAITIVTQHPQLQSEQPPGRVFHHCWGFQSSEIQGHTTKVSPAHNSTYKGENTLDHIYTNMCGACNAVPCPNLGHSDHISVLLKHSYKLVQKHEKLATKSIKVWSKVASSAPQDCFDCTDWNVFKEATKHSGHTDLQEYAASTTGFISKCVDVVVLTRTITIHPNQRPWLNAKVNSLLKACDDAFRSGDKVALRAVKKNSKKPKTHMPPE